MVKEQFNDHDSVSDDSGSPVNKCRNETLNGSTVKQPNFTSDIVLCGRRNDYKTNLSKHPTYKI